MKIRILNLFILGLILFSAFACCSCSDHSPAEESELDPPSEKGQIEQKETVQPGQNTLSSNSIKYLGSFLPPEGQDQQTYEWSATGLAYNPNNDSLFMVGHDHYQLVGEISIPEPVKATEAGSLPRARVIQALSDITEGKLNHIGFNGRKLPTNIKIGGLLVQDNKLLVSSYAYHEDAEKAVLSHGIRGLDFSVKNDFKGMFKVGDWGTGYLAGYMAEIPEEMRRLFKATTITGQGGIPKAERTSLGPSAFSFDIKDLGKTPCPAKTLLAYPLEHPTLGTWDNETSPNPPYNMSTQVTGMVFPKASSQVIFFGSTGLGVPGYGQGTNNKKLDRTKIPNYDEKYVYDPAQVDMKGTHAWPYAPYVWLYAVEDLLKVANQELNPWDIVPTDHFPLFFPYTDDTKAYEIGGVAYDAAGQRIFVAERRGYHDEPVIHVYKLGDESGSISHTTDENH
ncbi:MAG TPA: hypothetical protein PK646_02375 [Bacillota bacterium]|jgi:hypothetical protein|nr:hypothetical protein [Fastidiosipila sp.]HPX93260.1 hypothetical protein [Bacillota bacterium]HQB80919.1 hypothetical protein [Bacillota bacterium]